LLAAKKNWMHISPVLMVEYRQGRRIVTRVDPSGRRTCQTEVNANQTAVLTIRAGVAEACMPDPARVGDAKIMGIVDAGKRVQSQVVPADPATSDIRDVRKLIAGGRGLGSQEGFELLRKVAESLGAGVAASRMAVDLGWIEYDRQVGQTGKTVEPDLYIACGISGASHHLQGIAAAKHVIAINTDPNAPIMNSAQLGLVADLYLVLKCLQQRLES
jgi:electron transfer flavoprotein alpha subunit